MENKGIGKWDGHKHELNPKELMRFKINASVKSLFVGNLEILEELFEQHDDAMEKLRAALPEEYKKFVDLADYLNDAKFEGIRKKILSSGNDVIRTLEKQLENL